MGKQSCYYMTEQDEDDFVEFLMTTGDIVILATTSSQEQSDEFSRFRALAGRPQGETCVIWNRALSPRPLVEYYPTTGLYCIDDSNSEVISVLRSKSVDRRLSMGRLYIQNTALLPNGTLANKSPVFVKWFEQLRRWIKRHQPHLVDGAYASENVLALKQSGMELTGHHF